MPHEFLKLAENPPCADTKQYSYSFKLYKKYAYLLYTKTIMSSALTITHPRICEYYRMHPNVNVEEINLRLLEILETCNPPLSPTGAITSCVASYAQQPEWKQRLSELKELFASATQSLMLKFLALSTEYVLELKSRILDTQPITTSLTSHNNEYIQKCWAVLYSEISETLMRQKLSYVYDKMQQMMKQYHKTLQSNLDSVVRSTLGIEHMLPEYIQNYETNTGNLVQSIHQIMMDFVSSKEELANKLIANGQSPQLTRLNYEIQEIIQSLRTPLLAQYQSHPSIETLLSQLYPTSSVSIYMENEQTHYGYTVLRATNQPTLYIQSMDIKDRNVSLEETKQFTRTIQELNVNGVFISQNTGITSKPNYHIDIINNKVVVFLHQMNYSHEKLQIAIDMVDHIHSKLCEFNMTPENRHSIPKEILEDINREYQSFIQQKETILNYVKESNRKLIGHLEEITFPQLDVFLLTKFASCKKQGYTCDLCHQFNVGTLKGLAAHKRGCNRKLGLAPNVCTPTTAKNANHITVSSSVSSSINL